MGIIKPIDIIKYSKSINVLYAEDNKVLRDVMEDLLEHYFNNLDVAEDGQEALEMYLKMHDNNTPYDLIITDINMPNMNGIDMSREILKLEPSQKIIVVSAYSEYITSLKEIGITAILSKPIQYKELSGCIFEVSKEIYDNNLAKTE